MQDNNIYVIEGEVYYSSLFKKHHQKTSLASIFNNSSAC